MSATIAHPSDGQTGSVALREGCGECRLEWRHLVALGDEQSGLIGAPGALARDSRGRYLAVSEALLEQILVFDSAGAFLRAVGRQGRGPGEYLKAAYVSLASGDSLYVVDPPQRRVTLLTPDLTLARTWLLPGSFQWDMVALDAGLVLMNLYVGTPDRAGFPLHVLDADGKVLLSFGGEDAEPVRRDLSSTTRRKLARSLHGTVWSARTNRYEVVEWNLHGQKLRQFTRQPQWFEQWITPVTPAPGQPPRSRLESLHEDSAGLLWVLITVADAEWEAGLETRRTPEGRFYVPRDPNDVYDTIVEVIEPISGTVIVSHRLPMQLWAMIGDGLAFSYRASDDAGPQFDVWHLRVHQATTKGVPQ